MSNYVNISSTFWSFRTVRILMEVNYLSAEYTCLSVRWSIGSSIEKNQACSYVESRVWIWSCINIHRFFFGKFGLSRFWCKFQSKHFFKWTLHYKCKSFHWETNGRNQTCFYQETSVRMSTWIKIHSTFSDCSDCQDSNSRTKSESFSW